jgi:phosphonate transport system substrate-binding protein
MIMKNRKLLLGIWLLPLALIMTEKHNLAAAESNAELRIAFIAYQNPDQLLENVKPVVGYLKHRLGMEIKEYVATDYSSIVEALRNKTADVGFMGPLQYVMAHRQAGAIPILGEIYNGKATYVSQIFVRKDSGLKKLEDLRNKNIAFVDPISSSGYMYPLDIFRSKGLTDKSAEKFFNRVYFAGGDEQAIRAVYNGFVDAAGIGQYSFNLLRSEERDEVVAIGTSRPIPSHCLVARKGLSKKTVEKLQEAFLNLSNDDENSYLLKYLYSVDGYVKVTHENYLEVEELGKRYDFIR